MTLRSGVKGVTVPQMSRKARALQFLQAQLKKGTKNTKEGEVPLTEKDIKRINKEITILKTRIS